MVVGKYHQLRCGYFARVDGVLRNGHYHGRLADFDIPLEWDSQGRRVPAVGKDPCDIVGPAAAQESAA